MAITKLYKNSYGAFVFGNKSVEIFPAGVCRLVVYVKDAVTYARIYNIISKTVEYEGPITDLRKADNSPYASESELLSGVWDFFTKQSANSGFQRHDDMLGIMSTVASGSALGTLAIRDTGCTMLCFENANDDIAVQIYQFSHKKKLNTNLDSVHLHYYLPSQPGAGQTLRFNYWWTWYNNGEVIPAIGNWNTGATVVHTFTGTELAFSTGIITIISDLDYPANEAYSSILRVKVVRDSTGVGSDTYNDDLGIDYFDVHYIVDKQGSIFEYSDTI